MAPTIAESPLPPEPPPTPALTLDDVRELVSEELARTQEDLARLVQAELAREQEERRRASLTTVQAVADSIYDIRADSIRVELEALPEEEERTLQDHDRPLRERMEEVDYIRERMAKAEGEIAEVEEAAARRVAEAAHMLAELEGRGVVADMREELERQKRYVAALPALVQQAVQERGGEGERGRGGLPALSLSKGGLWPTLIALVLVAVVGTIGMFQYSLWQTQRADMVAVRKDLAELYTSSGQPDEAEQLLKQVLSVYPDDEALLMKLGNLYFGRKQHLATIEVFERYVSLVPDDSSGWNTLGWAYLLSGQPGKAIDPFLQTDALEPGGAVKTGIGRAYAEMGQCDKAIPYFRAALLVDPNRESAQMGLANCGGE